MTPKQTTILQNRSVAQMLADFGTGKDGVFFAEVANISLSPYEVKLQDAFKAYVRYRKTAQPHLLTKFQRELHELQSAITPTESTATADKYAEFCASVFVTLGQQVNFNISLFEWLQLFKLTIKKY